MEIEFLILADAVEAVNNKLYMLGGGWDQLTVGQFPTFIRLGIAVGISIPNNPKEQDHSVQFVILTPEEQVIMQMEIAISSRPSSTAASSRLILPVNVGLQLPSSGAYRVIATVDAQLKREVVFRAVLVTPS